MKKLFISDIRLAAYLISKGFRVSSTNKVHQRVVFSFNSEAEKLADMWQFAPNEEIKNLQRYLVEKDKLLNFVKSEQRKEDIEND